MPDPAAHPKRNVSILPLSSHSKYKVCTNSWFACGTLTSNIWFPKGLRTVSFDCEFGDVPEEEIPLPCVVDVVPEFVPCVEEKRNTWQTSQLVQETNMFYVMFIFPVNTSARCWYHNANLRL